MKTSNLIHSILAKPAAMIAGALGAVVLGVAPAAKADTFAYTGNIQSFVVPETGTYIISAAGAQGGGSASGGSGGLGASVQGKFVLTGGTVLQVVVGGQGGDFFATGGGGGGGSFVFSPDFSTLYAAAGGGGGGCGSNGGAGLPATSGGDGYAGGLGGTNGSGGAGGPFNGSGGGGAGWLTNGAAGGGINSGAGGSSQPSFLGGGGFGAGGFGGGGGGGGSAGGGGGGYSGGGGAAGGTSGPGGGGGSFLLGSATEPILQGDVRSGNGEVTITFVPPPPQVLFQEGDNVPGVTGATFSSFGVPATNENGDVAFLGKWSGGAGIFVNGTLLVAVDDVIDGTTTIRALKDPVIDDAGRVAFPCSLEGTGISSANDAAIVSNAPGGTLAIVAQEGTQAAGAPTGAVWKSFTSVSLPGGGAGALIYGSMKQGAGGITSSTDKAVWSADSSGTMHLVLQEGVTEIGGRVVKSFAALKAVSGSPAQTRAFNSSGDLVAKVTFADGDQAVVHLPLP
jgi:hypothetical protein